MLRSLFAVSLLLLLFQFAEGQWKKREAVYDFKQYGYSAAGFHKVHFSDSANGWAVGNNGVMMQYRDNLWMPVTSGVSHDIHGVYATDPRHAYAVGAKGVILRYENGNWTRLFYSASVGFEDVFMIDSVTAWAVGGRAIVKITGNTITPYTYPSTDVLSAVYFENPNLGWAVGYYGTILRYADGDWKLHWRGDKAFYDIDFDSNKKGYLVSLQAIWKLYDGTWVPEVYGTGYSRQHTLSIAGTFGMTSGIDATAFKYQNGVWQPFDQGAGDNVGFSDVHMINQNLGWGVTQSGTIFKWSNGKWTHFSLEYLNTISTVPYREAIASVFATDKNNVWINGNYVHLPNNGDWTNPKFDDSAYYSIFFIDKDNGWSNGAYPLAKWQHDGWADLYKYPGGQEHAMFQDLFMFSPNDGWMVGLKNIYDATFGGVITHYNGSDFENYPLNLDGKILNGVHFSDKQSGWAVGEQGTIVKYSNAQWSLVNSSSTEMLYKVFTVNGNTAWSVGDKGTLLKYDGAAWQKVNSGTSLDLHGVWFSDPDHGWAVGDSGLILRYNHGLWERDSLLTSSRLLDVHFTDSVHGWVVGLDGTILQYTTENVNRTAEQPIPNTAYPNPSPGMVTIRYKLPEAGNAYLRIFNQYGNLVASIDLGNQTSGEHTYNYIGFGLQNGLYYYQLSAGNKKGNGEFIIVH